MAKITTHDFFANQNNVSAGKCNILTHLSDVVDCGSKKESFIDIKYNIVTGSIVVASTADRPTLIGDILYEVRLNKNIVESSVANSILSCNIQNLSKLNGDSIEPEEYNVRVSAFMADKSAGCDFDYLFKVNPELIVAEKLGTTYTVKYDTDNTNIIVDMDTFSYEWFVDETRISSLSGKSADLNDNFLSLLTKKLDIKIKVKIVELNKTLDLGTIRIERNGYSINTTIATVINGTRKYGNISSTSTTVNGASIAYFIDNTNINNDSFDYETNKGKTLASVLTETPLMASFDKNNLSSYISYREQEIPLEDMTSESMNLLNVIEGSILKNSYNPNRQEPVTLLEKKLYSNFLNKKFIDFDLSDKLTYVENLSSKTLDRAGRIYTFDNKLYCVTGDITPVEVNLGMLVEKNVLMVDVESTSLLYDTPSIDAFFEQQNPSALVQDGTKWISTNDGDNVSLVTSVTRRMIQVQFEIRFSRGATNKMSKLIWKFETSSGSIAKYGLERLSNGAIRIFNPDGTVTDTVQDEYSKQFIIRLATQSNIVSTSIDFIECHNDSMKIKDIVVTEET